MALPATPSDTFRFDYQIIPAEKDHPILAGSALMRSAPDQEELRRIVEPLLGGTLMRAGVVVSGETKDMFVDDIGSLKELPRNELATDLYRAAFLADHPGTDPESLPVIYGPAALFDEQVWF